MTTEDSTENMPDVIYAGFTEIAKGPVWFPEKTHGALEYYSQAELDRRVAKAEERQRDRCAEAYKELVTDFKGEIAPCFDPFIEAIINAGGNDSD